MGRFVSKEEALNAARTRGQPALAPSHMTEEQLQLKQDVPTFGESVQHGLERQGLGIKQLVSGIVEPTGLLPEGTTQAITDRLNEKSRQYMQSRRGAEGTDWGQFVGETLPWAAGSIVTEGAAMALKGAPLGMKQMAKMGAAEGGVIGAAQPSKSPYGSPQYLTEKVAQTGMGVGMGGVSPPVTAGAVRGLFWLGKPIKKGINGLMRFNAGAASPKMVEGDVGPLMEGLGFKWKTMTAKVRQVLAKAVDDQVSKRKNLDRSAIARAGVLEGLGYVDNAAPTRGQLTRDTMELFNEAELAKLQGIGEPLAARFDAQRGQFRSGLETLGDSMGVLRPPLSKEGTATVTFDRVNKTWGDAQKQVGKFYDDVRNSATWDNVVGMDDTMRTLDDLYEMALDDTRSYKAAKRYLENNGEDRMTVARSERLRKIMGKHASSNDPTEMMTAREIIDAIDDDNINTLGRDPHRQARDAARSRFGMKNDRMIKKILEDRVREETFLSTQILGGNGKSNKALRKILEDPIDIGGGPARQQAMSEGRDVINAIRGAIFDHIVEKSAPMTLGRKQKVFGTGMDRALKSINPDVLKVWFDQQERELLLLHAQGGEWLFDRIENFSHTGASLKNDLLKILHAQGSGTGSVMGQVPVVGGIGRAYSEGVGRSSMRSQVADAMAGGIPQRPKLQENIERLTGRLAPRIGVIGLEERKR